MGRRLGLLWLQWLLATGAGAGPARWRARRRQPTLLKVADPLASCPKDRTGLLSPSTACCYQRLVADPDCCLDQTFKGGVTWRWVDRPGTSWACKSSTGCYDALSGPRGRDLMVIPEGASCSSPRMLYVHGGSWLYGSPNTSGYGQFASRLAVATGAVIFVIDYALVPYGNYSTILASAVDGLRWLAAHGPEAACASGGQPRSEEAPLFVGGDSSGGGTAVSVVLQLQATPELAPGVRLSGAAFFSPWTNLMCNTPEYYTNAFAKINSPETFRDLTPLQQYVGDIIFQAVTSNNADEFSANAVEYLGSNASLQTDPIASSYFAGPEDFGGEHTPALHFMVGGSESILGDSVRVAYTAAAGGADVTLEIYNGMWHVFPMYSEGCGSGTELWHAVHAINTTGAFVRRVVAEQKERRSGRRQAKDPASRRWNIPLIHYLYDPKVSEFTRVGELMPRTAAWGYREVMKAVAREPWWVVLPSLGGSAIAIFAVGLLVGGLLDFGGREAYKRARRVAEYRRRCVEVPIGYVSLDALRPPEDGGRSFLLDFVTGVPEEDVRSAWRNETVRAKKFAQGDSEAVEAARAENVTWRRMALPSYKPPPEVLRSAAPPPETLDSGRPTKDLIAEVLATGEAEAWAVATTEAKEGTIDAARRENLAWRMRNVKGKNP
uniref:Alpha/beta hydrolase fold-3 domain-containing protein n=1 Tax=Alexandrium monilatum TaxID=311494 RepID=A0A7S4T9W5_9DINO